jgi:hypothetical protein
MYRREYFYNLQMEVESPLHSPEREVRVDVPLTDEAEDTQSIQEADYVELVKHWPVDSDDLTFINFRIRKLEFLAPFAQLTV